MAKYFCPQCQKTIRFYSPNISANYHCPENLDGIFVLAHYDGIIRKAIKEVKYRGKHAIFSEIAQMFPQKLNFNFDYLVPVPLSKGRQTERGFNQAERLAQYLNEQLAINNEQYNGKVVNLLERVRETRPQFDLKIKDRAENVKDAFAINSKFKNQNLKFNFCLIDDVATTGATINECAKVLKKAGASKVYAICIARGG